MTRPTIAVVAPSLDFVGGQEVQASTMIHELEKEGYTVFFVRTNPRFPRALQNVRSLPYARTLLNQVLYVPTLSQLRRADVVHVFSSSYWSFLLGPVPALVAARRFGKRTILHYHSGLADDHLARWRRVIRPWLRLVDEIVVPSKFLCDAFARHGYSARTIPNVVDLRRFAYRDRSPLRPRLLSTRNFAPYYRVDVTLEAFALVKARYPDATLTVVGYGSEEPRLRRLADEIGGGSVRFAGRVEPSAMPTYYDGADIFLNSSVVDNQPLSVLEAFAAGLPVVSTASGDIAAIVRDGQTGRLVPAAEPAAMAMAVAGLLGEPDRALSMARHARQEVEQYTWPYVRDAWAAVYSRARAS
jgi:glycosyltransferase involved in cell wall biosynthesis